VLLDEQADLAVLLVALALPAAMQAERDSRRGDPEPEARGAGATDQDPGGIQVGPVRGVLAGVLLERERGRLEVEAGLGGEALDEAVGDVVGLAAQLAGEVGGSVLALDAGVPRRRPELGRDLRGFHAHVERLGGDADERLGLLEVPEDAGGVPGVLRAQRGAEVGEGDVPLGVAEPPLEPAETLERVRSVLPHERPGAALVGAPEQREDVCRRAGSGSTLATRPAAREERVDRLELVGGVLG
jgi:hypothetical protein